MSLKPFTYPLPETRFFHAGRGVYKFKIRYGNFKSAPELDNTESVAKELEEAIRVILGNLDDLHPFSTVHFTIFPYLSKWESVSKMRFKHKNVHLVPYPYMCTMYLELNSFQQNLSVGKEVSSDTYEPVKRRNEMPETTEVKETVKRRRAEGQAETPYPQLCIDRPGAESAHQINKGEHGFEKNYSKEIQHEHSPASLTVGCNQESSRKPMEYNVEQSTDTSQAEREMQPLQPADQTPSRGTVASEGRGLSKFWRSCAWEKKVPRAVTDLNQCPYSRQRVPPTAGFVKDRNTSLLAASRDSSSVPLGVFFSPLQHLFGGKN